MGSMTSRMRELCRLQLLLRSVCVSADAKKVLLRSLLLRCVVMAAAIPFSWDVLGSRGMVWSSYDVFDIHAWSGAVNCF